MKHPLKYYLFLVCFTFQYIYAQEGLPIYSDYLTDNYYLLHPSMAGAAICSQIRVTARRLWVGQENAPGLQTLSYNSRITDQSGIGAIVFNDKNGYTSQSGGYATYAHHILFSRNEVDLNMLSFGLSAGILQYRVDQSDIIANGDPLIIGGSQSTSEFNIDFGFSYNLYNFYAHVTAKNILKNSGVNNDLQLTSNLRRYLVSSGYVIGNFEWSLEPSIMLQYQEGTEQSSIDFNIKLYRELKESSIYGGISYRKSFDGVDFADRERIVNQKLNYITPFAGINLKKITLAYTYTYQVNSLVFNNGGFHQLTLGYDFNCRKEKYQCKCPAIN